MQFWKDYDLSQRYNGKIKGVLSVDISDWLYTEFQGKLAENCDADTVAKLAWEQMKLSLNVNGKVVLRDDMIEHYYLDRDIKYLLAGQNTIDKEPLLINAVNTWAMRPQANTLISNMYLASDYVRTNTDLATMEGANEAARRAVNSILADTGSDATPCEIWPLHEPALFLPLKWWDSQRFANGQPWSGNHPWWLKAFMWPWGIGCAIVTFFGGIWHKIAG